jgi:hypothetical protein
MIISYQSNFIFVHLHKTGGDSIAAALAPQLGREDFILTNDFKDWAQRIRSGSRTAALQSLRKHSTAMDIQRVVPAIQWAESFKFGFVRHPVGRAVSLYKYAARKEEERRRLLIRNAWYLTPPGRRTDPRKWRSVRAYVETSSFSEFIRHPALKDDRTMQPQADSLCDSGGLLLVDFVGKFEHLQEDFSTVQERLRLPRHSLGWHNASNPTVASALKVTEDDRAFLAERFKPDFDQFDYDPNTDA